LSGIAEMVVQAGLARWQPLLLVVFPAGSKLLDFIESGVQDGKLG